MSRVRAMSESSTVEEVLEKAAEFGRAAHGHYVEMIPRVSKNVRYIVEDLAREELAYIRMLQELRDSPDIATHLADSIARPHADKRFSDAFHQPDLPDDPDDQDVLQYALALEQAALDEFSELAEATEPGLLHDVFRFLANEERKHKGALEALYYEIVHAGGV